MAYSDTRRYPYTAPVQKHGKGKGKSTNRQDKAKGPMSQSMSKSSRPAGMEGTTGRSNKKGMAKKPKGTPVVAPGGRMSRAKGYAL